MSLKYLLLSIVVAMTFSFASAQTSSDTSADGHWADKKMKHLSLEEKVGQLMFVRVPQNMNKKQQNEFEKDFTKYKVGGICFFKGTAEEQLDRTRRYQEMSDIPLFVTIDGEWGLGMRLTDCWSFPRQMMLGALSRQNDTLISLMGEEIGKQCSKMGIHINFAPVCDINSNPANPVIGYRSFGENKKRVARKAAFYARGMQRKGIIAVGKHFPGHGDTETDSHLELPIINHPKSYIDSVDLFPFRHLVNNGIRGMMVAHLHVVALDNRTNMPSSLSERIINPILRQEMKFDGLIFTDGIDMKAVSNNFKDGEGAIRAIRAGSDVILLPIDVKKTIDIVVKEAKKDPEFAAMIDDRCRRILKEKHRSGLHKQQLDKLAVPSAADKERCDKLTRQMAQKALTLVRNEREALPLKKDEKVIWIAVGNCDTAVTRMNDKLSQDITDAGKVVISLYGTLGTANNYGVTKDAITIINSIASMPNVKSILVIYGSPYILASFPNTNDARSLPLPSAIVMAYQNIPQMVEAVPPALYGTTAFEGSLPISCGGYKEGTAMKAKQPKNKQDNRYQRITAAGMKIECFRKIDSIAQYGIQQHAYPGCQVLVAKDGKIVYNQCYGRQTYAADAPKMDTNTVYDLASLTKISATNLAVMKLVDAGKISLDDKLSRYLPYLKHTNKQKITIRQALSHIARLKAFDSYWKPLLNTDSIYIGNKPPYDYIAIGDNFYVSPKSRSMILDQIAHSELEKKQKYLYSDLGFILLGDLVQTVSGQTLDIFVQQQFYQPLGMKNTCFQPLQHGIDIKRIAPTENDKTFRMQQLRGYVHDPNAAAMGGVSGHAGLFSTANDLFRLYQMMLDSGRFEGRQYISVSTFNTFNNRYYTEYGNRRALGFDKPFINGRSTHIAPMASQQSFGHTGFTGIMVWVDPRYNLIYIFLSNRVYPSASPNKLSSLNIRTDIQEQIYKSIGVR